MGMGVIIIGDN